MNQMSQIKTQNRMKEETRTGYTIEVYNNMTGKWDRQGCYWNRRYTPVRREFEALMADAKNADMIRKFRIVETRSNTIFESWSNRE